MEACTLTVEELLNFNLGEENNYTKINNTNIITTTKDVFNDKAYQQALDLPEFAEEDLEWLSNKDSFPSLESCLDILTENPTVFLNHNSPVSVLDNLNIKNSNIQKNNYNSRARFTIPICYPMKPRSNLRRRRSCFPDPPTQHFVLWGQEKGLPKPERIQHKQKRTPTLSVAMGRKCTHCQVDKTPQWRAGPTGPKTLCNACGVRYKSGRLVPEYRPANSPTFSSVLHSNSHRKVVEMRREKQLGGVPVNEPCVYNRLAWSRERLSQSSSYRA